MTYLHKILLRIFKETIVLCEYKKEWKAFDEAIAQIIINNENHSITNYDIFSLATKSIHSRDLKQFINMHSHTLIELFNLYLKNDAIDYLHKSSIYDLLNNNMRKFRNRNFEEVFDRLIKDNMMIFAFISNSFFWYSTPEGREFWRHQHVLYVNFLTKLLTNKCYE